MVRALASHARGRRFEPYCLYHYGKLAFSRRHKEGTGSTVPFLYSRSFVLRFPFDCAMRILK